MVSCRIGRADGTKFEEVIEGITRRSIVYGEKSSICEFNLKKGAAIPLHAHPHEQSGYLVSGKIRFTIDGEEYLLSQGDSWCILNGVEHKLDVIEDSFVVEVFAPVREEFITKV